MLEPVLGLLTSLAHITGGGLPGKLPGVIPNELAAEFDTSAWVRPAIFDLIQRTGNIPWEEMYQVFNMGLGMVAVCREPDMKAVQDLVPDAVEVGRVVPRESGPQVLLSGL